MITVVPAAARAVPPASVLYAVSPPPAQDRAAGAYDVHDAAGMPASTYTTTEAGCPPSAAGSGDGGQQSRHQRHPEALSHTEA